MGNPYTPATGPGSRRVALGRDVVTWLMTRSFVLYATIVVAQRAWTLLNSDVGHLLRRFQA